MNKMKIYISGPMAGIPNFNRAAFKKAQITLEALGHEVFNPGDQPPATRRQILEFDITWICRHAEGMVMLFDWVRSSGAAAERATAKALGIPVWYQAATNPDQFISKFMLYDPCRPPRKTKYLTKATT